MGPEGPGRGAARLPVIFDAATPHPSARGSQLMPSPSLLTFISRRAHAATEVVLRNRGYTRFETHAADEPHLSHYAAPPSATRCCCTTATRRLPRCSTTRRACGCWWSWWTGRRRTRCCGAWRTRGGACTWWGTPGEGRGGGGRLVGRFVVRWARLAPTVQVVAGAGPGWMICRARGDAPFLRPQPPCCVTPGPDPLPPLVRTPPAAPPHHRTTLALPPCPRAPPQGRQAGCAGRGRGRPCGGAVPAGPRGQHAVRTAGAGVRGGGLKKEAVTLIGGNGSSSGSSTKRRKTTHCSCGPPSTPAPTARAGRLAGA